MSEETSEQPNADAAATHKRLQRRRWTLIATAVGALLSIYLVGAYLSGGALPGCSAATNDEAILRQMTTKFWEDIQFKDFETAATYHDPATQDRVDIPYLLERLFMEKPEFTDVQESEVMHVDIDSTELRGRVRSRVRVKYLRYPDESDSVKDHQIMLYYKRASKDADWYMDLQSSLRSLDADDSKAH